MCACDHSRLHQRTCQLLCRRSLSITMTEEKLDTLLKSVDAQEHAEGQRDLRKKLEHLEKEVATGQEDATQRHG